MRLADRSTPETIRQEDALEERRRDRQASALAVCRRLGERKWLTGLEGFAIDYRRDWGGGDGARCAEHVLAEHHGEAVLLGCLEELRTMPAVGTIEDRFARAHSDAGVGVVLQLQ